MNEEEALLDSKTLPTQEFVAQSILRRFPQACLKTREAKAETIFEIYFQESLLLSLDKKGARYFFPTRRKRVVKWEKITTFGLPRVIEYILRDLAEANYEVLSTTNKEVLKRPIHISRLMRCPECKEGGGIKIIVRGESLAAENSEIYTAITSADNAQGAEIKCILCGWIGIREQLLRKVRRSRKSIGHDQG
jgi:hypothetical protein